jgi:PAS domain S-box-containing protein
MKIEDYCGHQRASMKGNALGPEKIVGNRLIDALLDDSRSPIVLTDGDFVVIRINKAAAHLLGKPEQEASGLRASKILPPDIIAYLAAIESMDPLDGEQFRKDIEIPDYLGARRWYAACVRYLKCGECGMSNYLITIKAIECGGCDDAGSLNPAFSLKRMMMSFTDSVLIIDNLSDTICECNRASETLFGYGRAELLGRSPRFLVSGEGYARELIRSSTDAYVRQGFYQAKIRCRRKDGSEFLTLGTNLTLFNGGGESRYTLAINRDISENEQRLSDIARLTERMRTDIEELAGKLKPIVDPQPAIRLTSLGVSERQTRIAAFLCSGEPTKVIAAELGSSESTIKGHIHSMYQRIGVKSKIEFVNYLRTHNITLE